MSLFIKSLFGHSSIDGRLIKEGSIVEIGDHQYTESVRKLEESGNIKVSRNKNELILDKTPGITKAAAESLQSLNPPIGPDGKEKEVTKTINFKEAKPILTNGPLSTQLERDEKAKEAQESADLKSQAPIVTNSAVK